MASDLYCGLSSTNRVDNDGDKDNDRDNYKDNSKDNDDFSHLQSHSYIHDSDWFIFNWFSNTVRVQ